MVFLSTIQATAGLRQLKGDASDRILQAVSLLVIFSYGWCWYCTLYNYIALLHAYNAYILLLKVRDYLKDNSRLKSKSDSVTVLDGSQEGAYQWVCLLNFLNLIVPLNNMLCIFVKFIWNEKEDNHYLFENVNDLSKL